MYLLLYLAGALLFLFGFFFFSGYVDDNSSYVYLQYVSLVMAFFFLIWGIAYVSNSRPKKSTRREAMESRREMWRQMRTTRRERRILK